MTGMDDFILYNSWGKTVTSQLQIKVKRCENSTFNNDFCKTDEQIDEYIKYIDIDTWVIERMLDLSALDKHPTDLIMKHYTRSYLGYDTFEKFIFNLDKTLYSTFD